MTEAASLKKIRAIAQVARHASFAGGGRTDGWQNVVTKIGTSRDARMASKFMGFRLSESEVEELWAANDLVQRIIELPAQMKLRNGFHVNVAQLEGDRPETMARLDSATRKRLRKTARLNRRRRDAEEADELTDIQKALTADIDDLDVVSKVIEAEEFANAFGGCGLFMGYDDGQRDLSKPVRYETLRAVRYMIPLRPSECLPERWNGEPLSPLYGTPSMYRVRRTASGATISTSDGFLVHASRIVRFEGQRAPRYRGNRGWGVSKIDGCFDKLRDYDSCFEHIPILVTQFIQTILKIKGMAELLAGEDGLALLEERVEQIMGARGILDALVVDSEDELTVSSLNISGLPELLDREGKRFAAAAKIPAPLLYGDAMAGLNATGDANVRWFYDELSGQRERSLRPKINRILRDIFLSSEGPTGGFEPASWSFVFGTMWTPTDSETAELRYKVAQSDDLYIKNGTLTPEEVADSRFAQDVWSMETRLDTETRDLLENADPKVDPNEPPPGSVPPNDGNPGGEPDPSQVN